MSEETQPYVPYRETEPPKDFPEAADRVAALLKQAIGYLNECSMIHNSKCNNGGTPYPNGAEEALADYEQARSLRPYAYLPESEQKRILKEADARQ